MIVRLKIRTDQYFFLFLLLKVILHRLYITMNIDVTDICLIYSSLLVFIMQGSRIGKPTPSSFSCNLIPAASRIIFCILGIP